MADRQARAFPIQQSQQDPDGKNPHEPGAKLDAGKAPLFRGMFAYFPRALQAVSSVSEFGAKKYTWGGWADVENGAVRYADALGRHIVKEHTEGDIDSETGHLHAAHAAWNALARLELLLREKETGKKQVNSESEAKTTNCAYTSPNARL